MTYLKKIVDYINAKLRAELFCDAVFSKQMIIGIAQSLSRQNGEVIEIFPSYVNENGEACYVGPDDDFDLISYHRVNSITPVKSTTFKTFGDAPPPLVNQAAMSLIVFGIREKLHLTNDELAVHIQAAFPDKAPKGLLQILNFKTTDIAVSNINLNDLQVLKEEFQNIPFFLKPEQYLFKINYTIESIYLRECFTKKCNCT